MRNDHLKRPALALLVAALAAGIALAEPAPATLRVDQATAAALRSNLGVKSAILAERAKKRASELSFNKLYPTISMSATAIRLNDASPELLGDGYSAAQGLAAGEVAPNAGTYYYGLDEDNLALAFTVQEVFSVSYLLMMNQAALDYQSSSLDRLKAEKQMAAAAKETFYQLIVQREAIALTKARLEAANEKARQAKVSFDIGKGNELDYLNAKANAASLEPELRGMETARRAALSQFQDMLGLDPRPDMELQGSLDDEKLPSADEAERGWERIDVLAAELSIQKARSGIKLQASSLFPSLILQYKADPALNDPSSWSKVLDSDNWSQSSGGLSITLAVDLSPLIPGSAYNVKRQELQEQLALAKENEARARVSAAIDLANQVEAIKDSLAKIESLRGVAEDYKKIYEKTNVAYDRGAVRYLDLQNAEIASQSSQIQLLRERLNLLKLICDLEAKYTKDGLR
jgi:outer membrane protein TolC